MKLTYYGPELVRNKNVLGEACVSIDKNGVFFISRKTVELLEISDEDRLLFAKYSAQQTWMITKSQKGFCLRDNKSKSNSIPKRFTCVKLKQIIFDSLGIKEESAKLYVKPIPVFDENIPLYELTTIKNWADAG